MLYYIHQTPLSSWNVEGGSGDEITAALQLKMPATVESLCIYLILCLDTRLRTLVRVSIPAHMDTGNQQ